MIRLPGYSILFSNASWPNLSCYKDPKSQNLSSIIEKECRATTQYIWFYQPYKSPDDCAPMLEICEVQVYGIKLFFLLKNTICNVETDIYLYILYLYAFIKYEINVSLVNSDFKNTSLHS